MEVFPSHTEGKLKLLQPNEQHTIGKKLPKVKDNLM